MERTSRPLAPGWANLAAVALDRARDAIASSNTYRGRSHLLKMEVRRARGQLYLLWLIQPEDRELVHRLNEVRHQLAAASIETCEVCGCHVTWQAPRKSEVLCEAHDAPF